MSEFVLYVWCKRGGVSRDAGRECSVNAESIALALPQLQQEARALKRLGAYDSVDCQVRDGEDGPVVARFGV
jgi:hypothetical protein